MLVSLQKLLHSAVAMTYTLQCVFVIPRRGLITGISKNQKLMTDTRQLMQFDRQPYTH